ncbi:thioredoxin domain-containing protein [Chloroflexia bacterium SDU3-3]|nr:thioredoxin domain-containing protein [Chloroflexia bacterium SDU3-3]
MTTHKRAAARTRGRAAKAQQRNFFWIVGLSLMALAVVASVGLLGRRAADTSAVRVSAHPAPASAEPNGRAWGPKDAPITVIEYADYECESCGYFATNYEQEVVAAFASTGKVRFEIRNAPFHGEGARRAAQAAYCAAEQNMFWPFHDSLFLNQPAHGSAGFSATMLEAVAAKLGMDTAAFGACLSAGTYAAQVEADYQTALANGVTGTPTFVVNGKAYVGPQSADDLRGIFATVAPDVTLD